MTTLVNWCLALVLSVVVLGCGGGGKSGGGGGGPQGPKTPEEALAKLTPEDRQTFENWKLQVLKSCDATQAFNGRSGSDIHDMGIDPAALLHKNSLSMVVKGLKARWPFWEERRDTRESPNPSLNTRLRSMATATRFKQKPNVMVPIARCFSLAKKSTNQ